MALRTKRVRIIACRGDDQFPGCGKVEERSGDGPRPKWCLACEAKVHEGRLRRKVRGADTNRRDEPYEVAARAAPSGSLRRGRQARGAGSSRRQPYQTSRQRTQVDGLGVVDMGEQIRTNIHDSAESSERHPGKLSAGAYRARPMTTGDGTRT